MIKRSLIKKLIKKTYYQNLKNLFITNTLLETAWVIAKKFKSNKETIRQILIISTKKINPEKKLFNLFNLMQFNKL